MDRVMGSDKDTQRDLEGLPRHIVLAAAAPTYQMKLSDRVLIADTTGAGGDAAAIVTLPSVAEAAGQLFYIMAPEGASAYHLSVYEKETGAEYTDGDMDADDDYLILFCTGTGWLTVKTNVA